MNSLFNNPEIGRSLKASELKPKQVVVISAPGPENILLTVRVKEISEHAVIFYASTFRTAIINFFAPDDTIVDDRNHIVFVYEYLGEI